MREISRTNTHTYFFREPKAIAAVCDQILRPRALSGEATTIWCVGCATGEEPYSLAIAARESGAGAVRILASDLNPAALEHAERGRYRARALRQVDERRIARWFRVEGRDFAVDDEVRQMVSFIPHDVCSPPLSPRAIQDLEAKSWDVIFCRNVFLYLDPASIRGAILSLSSVMGSKSALVIGASEWLGGRVQAALPAAKRLESVRLGDALVYRRASRSIERPPTSSISLSAPAARAPTRIDQLRASGDAHLDRGAPGSALEVYREAARVDPLVPDIYLRMGICHTELDDGGAACDALRRCLFLAPDLWPAALLMGFILDGSEPKVAHRYFQQALKALESGSLTDGIFSSPLRAFLLAPDAAAELLRARLHDTK